MTLELTSIAESSGNSCAKNNENFQPCSFLSNAIGQVNDTFEDKATTPLASDRALYGQL
jgi:hypothetical protein